MKSKHKEQKQPPPHKKQDVPTPLELLINAMKHMTPINQPYSALHFARNTALYGYNSDVRECRTASLWETGGRPNKNSKLFLFLFYFRGAGPYSAWRKKKTFNGGPLQLFSVGGTGVSP